jgi:hypothetical protein
LDALDRLDRLDGLDGLGGLYKMDGLYIYIGWSR